LRHEVKVAVDQVQQNKTACLRRQPTMVGVTGYYSAVSA